MKLPLKITGFEQLNLGDKLGLGDLWQSFNLNLSKTLGTLLLSGRVLLNINTDDDAQLDEPPSAFATFITTDTYIWAVAGDFVWHSTATGSAGGPSDPFVQDATASTPTHCDSDQSDMKAFSSALVVTEASDEIYLLAAGGTWSALSNVLVSSSGIHQMTKFRATNKLYIVDDNAAGISSLASNLSTVVKSDSGAAYSLNDLVEGGGVNVGSRISCIASNTNRIGIGTISNSDNVSKFYTWNGSQTTGPNEEYQVDASGVLSVIVVDDVFVVFTTDGRLMQLNGGTFVEIARLPIDEASLKLPTSATDSPVHFNGMNLVDGNIEILINTQLWDTNSTINCPSGVWCYDRQTKSFYHKRSVGLTKTGASITDYGASKLSKVGALAQIEVNSTAITQGSVVGKILLGCDYYTDATTTKSGIFYDDSADTLQKAGYFITQKIFSNNITDLWQKVYIRFRRFLNSTDKIVVKARTRDDDDVQATITFTSTTTFTVPTASFSTSPAVGDEVEILQGIGAGRTAHITVVTTSAPNYAITVDETITGATTQTAKAKFQTWKKVGTYSSQTDDFLKLPIDLSQLGSSPWIQFKVWVLWTGKGEIYDIIISNKGQELIE